MEDKFYVLILLELPRYFIVKLFKKENKKKKNIYMNMLTWGWLQGKIARIYLQVYMGRT